MTTVERPRRTARLVVDVAQIVVLAAVIVGLVLLVLDALEPS